MYDILIVSLPGMDDDKPSAALGYLKSYIESYEFSVMTIDGSQVGDLEKLHLVVSQYEFKYIGVSVFSYLQKDDALLFGQEYDNVIYGGSGVYKGWPHGDYIVGDGEIALLEYLRGNKFYPGINGRDPEEIVDLTALPAPDYSDLLKPQFYTSNYKSISITGSRGCVRSCTFCDIADRWPKYRWVDGEILANRMLELSETTGFKSINLTDSLVNGSMKHFNKMCEVLAKSKKKVKWNGQFIIRNKKFMSAQNFDDIAESGCKGLTVGIESGSEKVRQDMKKKFSNEDADYYISNLLERNIFVKFLLIVGYPTETEQDFLETMKFLEKWSQYKTVRTSIDIMRIETGSPISYEEGHLFHMNEDLHDWENEISTFDIRCDRYVRLFNHAIDLGYKLPYHMYRKRDKFMQYKQGLKVAL
jgi:radical SAM superfamily enzyme YgiQ (UPF0313 family)